MCAAATGENQLGFLVVVALGCFHGPTGYGIDVACPIDVGVWFCPKELAALAVEDIKEAVLWRLHDHLTSLAPDREIGQHELLRPRIVPVVPWSRLIMPNQATGIGVDRQDATQK